MPQSPFTALLVLSASLYAGAAAASECNDLRTALKPVLIEEVWTDMRPLAVLVPLRGNQMALDQIRPAEGTESGSGEMKRGCLAVAGDKLYIALLGDGMPNTLMVGGALHASVARQVGGPRRASGGKARMVGPTPRGGVVFEVEVL